MFWWLYQQQETREIEDSVENTEKESVLAGALGEKAGLWPGGAGTCFMSRSVQTLPWKIIKNRMNILKYVVSFSMTAKLLMNKSRYNDIMWKSPCPSKVSHSAVLHDPPCPHAVYCGCPVTWGGGYLCGDTRGLWLVNISQHWPLIGSKVLFPFPVNQFAWTVSGQDKIAYNSPERVWEFVRTFDEIYHMSSFWLLFALDWQLS